MTSRIVAVLNIGNVLRPKCRDSIRAAAARWGADYVEVRHEIEPGKHVFWQKVLVPRLLPDDAHVCQLDADMLVRYDCPSPFDLVPPGSLGVVESNPRWAPLVTAIQRMTGHWSKILGVSDIDCWHHYFNMGFSVYSVQTHREFFQSVYDAGKVRDWSQEQLAEQTLTNLMIHSRALPIVRLPWFFNLQFIHRHDEVALKHSMTAYIYHFVAATKWMIPNVSWQNTDDRFGRVDAVLRHLPEQGPASVTEVGVLRAQLSSRLLALRPDLQVNLVDCWESPIVPGRFGSGNNIPRSHRDTYEDLHDAWNQTRFAAHRCRFFYFPKQNNGRPNGNADPRDLHGRKIQPSSQDVVFIDAEHDFANVSRDMRHWWPKVKPGGYLAGHDYDSQYNFGVTQAVSEFCREHSTGVELDRDLTWFVRKPTP